MHSNAMMFNFMSEGYALAVFFFFVDERSVRRAALLSCITAKSRALAGWPTLLAMSILLIIHPLQYNREPLSASNYAKTDKYNTIITLNTVRYLLSGHALVDHGSMSA
jgi:hypothetical protein